MTYASKWEDTDAVYRGIPEWTDYDTIEMVTLVNDTLVIGEYDRWMIYGC